MEVSENKGCPKNIFLDAKFFIYFEEKWGCPKTKGVRKHRVITVTKQLKENINRDIFL